MEENKMSEIRPWGSYLILEEDKNYKIKRISVNPKEKLSLQMHHHRSEHWIVVHGTAKVILDDLVMILSVGESTFVRSGVKHRLENPGLITLEIVEVSTGEYLGEDDIIRFEDDYDRIK